MDKAQDRILLTILSTALIFGAQAVYEYIKKRKAAAKARQTRHTRPASVADHSQARRPAPFVDYELRQSPEKPVEPLTPVDQTPSETTVESVSPSVPTADDIRRAVIWSEILKRKYD